MPEGPSVGGDASCKGGFKVNSSVQHFSLLHRQYLIRARAARGVKNKIRNHQPWRMVLRHLQHHTTVCLHQRHSSVAAVCQTPTPTHPPRLPSQGHETGATPWRRASPSAALLPPRSDSPNCEICLLANKFSRQRADDRSAVQPLGLSSRPGGGELTALVPWGGVQPLGRARQDLPTFGNESCSLSWLAGCELQVLPSDRPLAAVLWLIRVITALCANHNPSPVPGQGLCSRFNFHAREWRYLHYGEHLFAAFDFKP
jgi:hypothetical protein